MDKRQQYIEENSNFFLNGYRTLLNVLFVLLLVVFLLLGIIFYQNYARPLPKYFATTVDGRLIEIKPFSRE